MKKIWITLLAFCFLMGVFCSCNHAPAENTATPESTATAKATAAPTDTPTQIATATPVPTPAYDRSAYIIEFDASIISMNIGFLLAGIDYENFVMAQFSIGHHNDGSLYYRPHQWVEGNWEVLEELPVDAAVASGEYGVDFHVKLEMKKHVLTTYINGTKISQLEVEDGTYDMFGFRAVSSANEGGTFDNLSIANAEGTVIWTEDFDGETTYFDDALEDELEAVIENGKLVIEAGSDVLFLIDPPALG